MKVENESVIFNDSVSVVRGLHVHCYNSGIFDLFIESTTYKLGGKLCKCKCWIPSHIGIEGNAAKAASKR